jgi:chemosensory pili system protein ChpA (sensor histidine kinase/response regulator)
MTEPLDNTVFLKLVKEINDLLPEMKELLSMLKTTKTDHKKIIIKFDECISTIMGVASMINLDELTSTTNLLNTILNDILNDKLPMDTQVIKAVEQTTEEISRYCSSLQNNRNTNKEMFQNVMSIFKKFHINTNADIIDVPEDQLGSQENDLMKSLPDDDADDFFTNFDMNIFDENDPLPEADSSSLADTSKQKSLTDDIDPEFLESFNEESKDHLNNIALQLNLLSPTINKKIIIKDATRETLHSIRRSVHTLKGAAAVIGIKTVASFGNDFEDFLDWLHDESDSLSPEIITSMLDGTDILEKLSINPEINIDEDINVLNSTFNAIMNDDKKTDHADTDTKKSIVFEDGHTHTKTESNEQPLPGKVAASRTLRVDMGKVDKLIGLLGDMTINLSSHEDSSQLLKTTIGEFDNTMRRLKDITLSLETGFELATIPHINSEPAYLQKADQIIDEFDPLEMDRYSDLHIMIRSLNEAVADLNSIMGQATNIQKSWQTVISGQTRVVNEVQNSMQLIKMTPFSTLSNRLHKTVRESARVTNKSIQLVIEGGSLEMDTHVWNVLADPLMHVLRNSVDHGIEKADERKKTRKPNQATIKIKCVRKGSWLHMHISDDGNGLDYDAIKCRAKELYLKTDVSGMNHDELANLIFRQGFSTKGRATTISGRGVGMDVVDHAVKQLNGTIEVISNPGYGTEFILRLPIEVAQLPVLVVKFGLHTFAVPLRDITRIFKIDYGQSKKKTFKLDNNTLPLIRPMELLGLTDIAEQAAVNPFALVVDAGKKSGILLADVVAGKKDVVFKNLGSHLHNKVPCIAGVTIMGNGSLVPILNTEELFSRKKLSVKSVKTDRIKTHKDNQSFKILIVDDSISIRKVLSNFISNQGWYPSVAKDGVDAMEMIRQQHFHLILLDIEMPRMNGFDVLQSLQANSEYSNIPVLMLTSRSAKKYRDKVTELGAKGFVTKPFNDDKLISIINGFLEPELSTQKLKTGN